jgi:hypothetical protein
MATSDGYDSNRNLETPPESGRTITSVVATIVSVVNDRATPEMFKHLKALIEREIEERFPKPEGQRSYPGGQRAIAEAMHVSQPSLNQILREEVPTVGIDVLLGLRAYFTERGRPMSVDDLLGLPSAVAEAQSADGMIARLTALEAQVQRLAAAGPRVPGAKKLRDEVERARLTAVGTREAQRKTREGASYPRRASEPPKPKSKVG